MRNFRLGLVGTILAALLGGCGGGGQEETTMPTSPPTMPPEADQMKNEMTKKLGIKFQEKGARSSNSPKK